MSRTAALALTVIGGLAIGAGAIQDLHAQSGKKPGYAVAEVQVIDPSGFEAYAAKVPATLKAHNGRIVARGKPEAKAGEPPQGSVIILAFDSLADAQKWYTTAPYKDLIPERDKAAKVRFYFVEGLPQ